ncbi:MAG: nucleoside monophosphate kinase, partial [Oscillospiraceae bacterium]|nr:nucleoside monophosphate kinase [Oscillospiraceae bacterium]
APTTSTSMTLFLMQRLCVLVKSRLRFSLMVVNFLSLLTAGTALGKEAKKLIDAGNLVPDSVVEGMIETAFETASGINGFLLDGFPRTLGQAKDLDAILAKRGEKVNGVISIMIPDSLVYERIAHRALIEGRADDASPEIISNRIKTYHAQTEPLIAYYKEAGKYHECLGTKPTIEENRQLVLELMEQIPE